MSLDINGDGNEIEVSDQRTPTVGICPAGRQVGKFSLASRQVMAYLWSVVEEITDLGPTP